MYYSNFVYKIVGIYSICGTKKYVTQWIDVSLFDYRLKQCNIGI